MNRRANVAATNACGLTEEIVRTFGEVRLRVFGTSMVPSILPGDFISVQRAEVSEISLGEIVMYVRGGRFFAHRVVAHASGDAGIVVAQNEPFLITRGDRLRYNDLPVSSGELLGRVTSIRRSADENGDSREQQVAPLNEWERFIARLLRYSDHATYLYVKIAKLHLFGRRFTPSNDFQQAVGRTACRG